MARQLPWGRISKEAVPDSVRKTGTGTFTNKAVYGPYFDQILFEAHQEHILGNAAQLSSDFATITWSNSNARFEDKAGSEVTLDDYDRITVIGMDTLTANMVIDNVTGLEIKHLANTPGQSGDNPKFQLGDAGGGEPYKIKLGPNAIDCKLDILTDKPFEDLLRTLTLAQKRYIANQGRNNYIKVNGLEIYNPSISGEIFAIDTDPVNPYFIRVDGQSLHWSADASNVNLAWFRDLNIRLGGLRSDGTSLQETQSKYTTSAVIAASPYVFQVNTLNRFLVDKSTLDTRIHLRTSPTAALTGIVATFVFNSDVVSFGASPYEGDAKEGMRIRQNTYLPPNNTTTILLVDIDTTAHTAKMIDALTGSPVLALAGGTAAATVDNSGAASGSIDSDRVINITGGFHIRDTNTGVDTIHSATGAFATGVAGDTNSPLNATGTATEDVDVTFDASTVVNTHDQTQPKTSAVLYFYRP